MSIFDNNITSENTPLQTFYNSIKTIVENEFDQLYKKVDGDLSRVSSIYNGVLKKLNSKFAEHGMYHPYLHCSPIAGTNPFKSKVLVTILYSEDPSIYIDEDRKIFLQTTIPIPQLKDII